MCLRFCSTLIIQHCWARICPVPHFLVSCTFVLFTHFKIIKHNEILDNIQSCCLWLSLLSDLMAGHGQSSWLKQLQSSRSWSSRAAMDITPSSSCYSNISLFNITCYHILSYSMLLVLHRIFSKNYLWSSRCFWINVSKISLVWNV